MLKKLLLPLLPAVFLGSVLLLVEPPSEGARADRLEITPLPPLADPDGRLGICYGFIEDPPDSGQRPYLDLMYNAGARHDRWDFTWSVIQAEGPSQWNLNGHERIVRAENQMGVEVLGILLFTPAWASTCSGSTGWIEHSSPLPTIQARFDSHARDPLALDDLTTGHNCPPANLYEPVFVNGAINPQNYWGYFVYQVAKHFDGESLGDPLLRVNAWEIWNEPDWDAFWIDSPTATDDYCRLLQVAHTAIKGNGTVAGANPNATVLFGGLHYWANPNFYREVLDCLATADPGGNANNHFFDVMSVHLYSRSDHPYHIVNIVKSELTARGMGAHPIWLTESGAPIYGDASPGHPVLDKHDYYLSIEEQAAYTIQAYANALAAGVDRFFFFRAHDYDMWEPFGLIRNDQSLRPAYVAYQVAAKYLQGENQVTRVPTGAATRISLWGTPRGKVSVLWNRSPDPITYTLQSAMPTATLVDRSGVTQTLSAVNEHYVLTLPGATANLVSNPNDYIVGGDPFLLIETDTAPPNSALNPLPPVTVGPAVNLTWTANDADSGIWYTKIQVSADPEGPWTTFASLQQTQDTTQTIYIGEPDATYYFRASARDRVGNWEPWPDNAEVSTTISGAVTLHWHVETLFNDSNRNGEWDPTATDVSKPEIKLTDVSMRFVDADWRTITAARGSGWAFTKTLPLGTYTFVAEWEDRDGDGWLFLEPVVLDGTVSPLHAPNSDIIGLLPRQDFYLPVITQQQPVELD